MLFFALKNGTKFILFIFRIKFWEQFYYMYQISMYVGLNSRITLHNWKKNLEKIISERSYDFFLNKVKVPKK